MAHGIVLRLLGRNWAGESGPRAMMPPQRPGGPDSRDARPGPDSDREVIPAATIAKWLIPSATALFVVVGYIVETAQQDLLGLHHDQRDASTFIISSADFLRDLIGVPLAAASAFGRGSAGGHGAALSLATLLVVAVVWLSLPARLRSRLPARLATWRRAGLIATALTVLLVYRFAALDQPLFHVKAIILGSTEDPVVDSNDQSIPAYLKKLADDLKRRKPAESRSGRADVLVARIVCSRVSEQLTAQTENLLVTGICGRQPQAQHKRELAGEYVAHVWAAALVVLLAVALLRARSSSNSQVGLAVLALAYCLVVPYAYGKLRRPPYFDYGHIMLAPGAAGQDAAAGEGAETEIDGITLSRTSAATNVLRLIGGVCGAGPATYSTVTMSSFSPSQVLRIQKIYRQDVIAWAVLNERTCPPAEGLYGEEGTTTGG
jgi:hypothetical protein